MSTAYVDKPDPGPSGLGGWLILPIIGLVVSPFVIGAQTYMEILPAFAPEIWGPLTTPGSESYNLPLAAVIVGECVVNALLVGLMVFCLVLMVRKSRWLPAAMIVSYAASFGVLLLDTLVVGFLGLEPDAEAIRDIGRGFVACVIWIPYFLVSRRVRNTFVN